MGTVGKGNDESYEAVVVSPSCSSQQPQLLRPRTGAAAAAAASASAARKRALLSHDNPDDVDRSKEYYLPSYRRSNYYNNNKLPPIYHRHSRQDPTSLSSVAVLRPPPIPRGQRPSRLALVFPLLLFGAILAIGFLQPLPPVAQELDTIRSTTTKSFDQNSGGLKQQSAMAAMLHASRFRAPNSIQQQAPRPQHNPPPNFQSSQSVNTRQSSRSKESVELEGDLIPPPPTGWLDRQRIRSIHNPIDPTREEESFVIELNNINKDHHSTNGFSEPELTLFLQSGKANYLDDGEDGMEELEMSLRSITFRRAQNSGSGDAVARNEKKSSCPKQPNYPSEFLPIDDFPDGDPFLPWIHDYWYVGNSNHKKGPVEGGGGGGGRIQFVAQNKRRCETGEGKEEIMKHWEPQVALFQSIPIVVNNNKTVVQLADSLENATIPETRLLCHFHSESEAAQRKDPSSFVTFSSFNFNYEYVVWRKKKHKAMLVEKGKDVDTLELSQLLFSCPVPFAVLKTNCQNESSTPWYLDLVPLRTRVRRQGELALSPEHVGPILFRDLRTPLFGKGQMSTVPLEQLLRNSGRWANLPLWLTLPTELPKSHEVDALLPASTTQATRNTVTQKKPHNFVICTWTATNYFRRGDATSISDLERRLREWIVFHSFVGADHIYIYDNSQPPPSNTPVNATTNQISNAFVSPLKAMIQSQNFSSDLVTYIPWPCQSCSNNRPNHPNPGERSSQYAAEASCRERFGPRTEWMAFIDVDEYLVPMMRSNTSNTATRHEERVTSWTPVLELKRQQGFHVLKMRSSRGRPRMSLMESIVNDTEHVCIQQSTKSKLPKELCVQPRPSQTFLRVYNCEYIRPPKPQRFQRAMKQIYRPDFVLSHYVHYSTVTKPMSAYYREKQRWLPENNHHHDSRNNTAAVAASSYSRSVQDWEWGDVFLNELEEGCLVHTKSVLPHETMFRSSLCHNESKMVCPVGLECPDSTPFVDQLHTKNVFHDEDGNYCNCWINHHLEDTLLPHLEKELGLI